MMNEEFEGKLNGVAYKVEQISNIALCAILASGVMTNPAERKKHVDGVLYGIISLCEMLTDELNNITNQLT